MPTDGVAQANLLPDPKGNRETLHSPGRHRSSARQTGMFATHAQLVNCNLLVNVVVQSQLCLQLERTALELSVVV